MLGRRRCRLALGKCVVQEPEERRAGLQWDERDHAHLFDGHFFCFLDELLLEVLTCVSDNEAIILLHQFASPEKHRWTAEHRPPESESLGKQVLEDIEALRPDLGANKNLTVTHVHLLVVGCEPFVSHRVNTVLPWVRPSTMARIASLASSMGITAPISGLIPASITRRIMLFISSSVPMIEPMTVSFSVNRPSKFALGSFPEVTPTVTTVPPARTDWSECSQAAFPILSTTTSTRRGSFSFCPNVRCAPSLWASARPSGVRLVTHVSTPAARAI